MKKILFVMLLAMSVQSFAKTNAWRDCGLGPQPVGNVQQDEPLHHQKNISSLTPG